MKEQESFSSTDVDDDELVEIPKAQGKEGEDLGEIRTETTETTQEVEKLSEEEIEKLEIGINNIGFIVEAQKNAAFARVTEFVSQKLDKRKTFGRWVDSLAETYRKDEKDAIAKMEAKPDSKLGKAGKVMRNSSMLAGNVLRYGRVVADFAGATATLPTKYVMMASMMFSRGSEAAKEARFKNEEMMDQTRIQDFSEAEEKAWQIYEKAQEETEQGKETSTKDLQKAYTETLPQDIKERLEKEIQKSGVSGAVEDVMRKHLSWGVERVQSKLDKIESDEELSDDQKKKQKDAIYAKYERVLDDYDRMLTQTGTVDSLAYGARAGEKGGKAVVMAMTVETLYYTLHKAFDIASNFSFDNIKFNFSFVGRAYVDTGIEGNLGDAEVEEVQVLREGGGAQNMEGAVLDAQADKVGDVELEMPKAPEIGYQGGKSVWQEAQKQLSARFTGEKGFESLGEAVQTFDADKLKDLIEANPGDYGLAEGVDFNKLSSDQITGIDWNKAIEDAKFNIENPESIDPNLTPEQEANIIKNNQEIKEWADTHPGQELTTEKTEQILHGKAEPVKSTQAPVRPKIESEAPQADVLAGQLSDSSIPYAERIKTASHYIRETLRTLGDSNDYLKNLSQDKLNAFCAYSTSNEDILELSYAKPEQVETMVMQYMNSISEQTRAFFEGEYNNYLNGQESVIVDPRNTNELLVAEIQENGKSRFYEMNDDGTRSEKPISDPRGIFHRARKEFNIEQAKEFFRWKDDVLEAPTPAPELTPTEAVSPTEQAQEPLTQEVRASESNLEQEQDASQKPVQTEVVKDIPGGTEATTTINDPGRDAEVIRTQTESTNEEGHRVKADIQEISARLSDSEISRLARVLSKNLVGDLQSGDIKTSDQFCERIRDFKGSDLDDLERRSAENQFKLVQRSKLAEQKLREYLRSFLSSQDAGSLPEHIDGINPADMPKAGILPEAGRLPDASPLPERETADLTPDTPVPDVASLSERETTIPAERITEIDTTLHKFAELATGERGESVRASLVLEIGPDNISIERLTQILEKAENASLNDLSNWEQGDLRTYKDILDAIFEQREEFKLTNRPDVVKKFEQARDFVESILSKKE